ncbi:hypothetical protein EG68_09401 [Paragonimus skrjabini miyazakii]|uniref:D-glucuronyl C5-epimerase C-terminal domain-containing protein n=1 Tax=Paragonimus skrjabini miyazakii TaxID=59628 RepID=A0A8S9YHT1_9TREM|nr:hypothetical protein EG68_09401 [Paragonimus skrjabini miyazakii]
MHIPFRRRMLCVLLLCSGFLILQSFHHLKMSASEHGDSYISSLSSAISLNCSFNQKTVSGCFLVETFGPVIPFEDIKTPLELFGSVDLKAKSLHIHQADFNIPPAFPPEHDPIGQFMLFHRSDVEKRQHVKYISADIGVPISDQWDPNGHLYPIQIAQFGLSHFSKWIRLKRLLSNRSLSSRFSLDADLDLTVSTDKVLHSISSESWVPLKSSVGTMFGFVFTASNHSSSLPERLALHIRLHQENSLWRYFLLIGQQWHEGSFVQLLVSIPRMFISTGKLEQKQLVYICSPAPTGGVAHHSDLTLSKDRSTVTFWMPGCAERARNNQSFNRIELARDLLHDLLKGFRFQEGILNDADGLPHIQNLSTALVVVHSVEVYAGVYGPDGGGIVNKLLLGKQPSPSMLIDEASPTLAELLFHECRFMAATRWLLRNQHADGSWRTTVARHLHGRPTVKPGWASAMAQGHGISLMVRVHNCTGNPDYLASAELALHPYTKLVSNGGVLSHVFGQPAFPWYEEYPTEPGNHVLNGFIYSLIGLYDFSQVSLFRNLTLKTEKLWRAGLKTLSVVLPLFDSGSGSFYDLRHVLPPLDRPVLASQDWISTHDGPNRARWSYHALHIQQLRLLAKLDPFYASEWVNTATRWSGYMKGLRSPHN